MERYLAGEELDPHDIAAALKTAVTNDDLYPVVVRRRDEEPRHALAARPARRGRPVAGAQAVADRPRGHDGVRLQDRRRPVRRPDLCVPRLLGHGRGRHDADERARPREGAARRADGAAGQGSRAGRRVRPGRPRRGREAEGRADRRRARRPRARRRAHAEAHVPRAGDELRRHAEDEGRRGQGRAGPAAPARGGSDAAAPPRRADGRVAALGHEPGSRRGRGRAPEEPLRRRRRPAPAARAVRRDDPRRGARRRAATRSRPAAAASSATATS